MCYSARLLEDTVGGEAESEDGGDTPLRNYFYYRLSLVSSGLGPEDREERQVNMKMTGICLVLYIVSVSYSMCSPGRGRHIMNNLSQVNRKRMWLLDFIICRNVNLDP